MQGKARGGGVRLDLQTGSGNIRIETSAARGASSTAEPNNNLTLVIAL